MHFLTYVDNAKKADKKSAVYSLTVKYVLNSGFELIVRENEYLFPLGGRFVYIHGFRSPVMELVGKALFPISRELAFTGMDNTEMALECQGKRKHTMYGIRWIEVLRMFRNVRSDIMRTSNNGICRNLKLFGRNGRIETIPDSDRTLL